MDIEKLRLEIDKADRELLAAFEKRMEIAEQIGVAKVEAGRPILDHSREREKLSGIYDMADERTKPYISPLYSLLFEMSRGVQSKLWEDKGEDYLMVKEAIANQSTTPFPTKAIVACQGVEGAFSQEATEKLFKIPSIMYMKNFSQVFAAIESGLCQYGVLPVENSNAGTVSAVYDLMIKNRFKIVRSIRVKVDHNCLMIQGGKLSDIKEIMSHEQAINQCRDFIKSLGNDVKVTYCKNTAEAAKYVAESGRTDLACLASYRCSELYGLDCVKGECQDQGNNYTRFICISKNLEIYPGADRTSMMMVLRHEPGALYRVLSLLYSRGVNLVKLESRPLVGRDFEFMFYFDLETSVYNADFADMIGEISKLVKEFRYLGSYNEII